MPLGFYFMMQTHMCLTHRKISDFLTPEYSDMVFGKKKATAEEEVANELQRDNVALQTKGIQPLGSQGGMCRICNNSFPTESDLKKHEVAIKQLPSIFMTFKT
jgi:hypothetical protein